MGGEILKMAERLCGLAHGALKKCRFLVAALLGMTRGN
jgi:hypothetical protein